uniref:Sulfotransferase domain-containing protein n=1 Tax=Anopheles culicifacies TaxID=139723 RepID=A0A182MUE1_9DIPT
MSCRKNHILRIAAVGVFILLMYGSYWYSSNSYGTDLRSWERSTNRRMLNSHKHYGSYGGYGGRAGSSYDTYPPMTTAHSTNITIENVLSIQRELIAAEWSNSNDDPKLLHGLTPETDGNPMRSVIITTWRSGSTFLGDILNSLPGNFYHYEPLLDFDIVQIRGPPNDSVALHNLRNLLHCDYNEMENYLEFGRTHSYLFSHNTRLWQQCVRLQQFCYEPRFLGPFCRLFPRQSMKVVRLRLALATPLLEDDSKVALSEKVCVRVAVLVAYSMGMAAQPVDDCSA